MICASVWRIWRWNVAAETLSALVERVHQTQTPEDGWCFESFGCAVAQAVAERDRDRWHNIDKNFCAVESPEAALVALREIRKIARTAIRAAEEGE